MKEIKGYECEFCGYQSLHDLTNHEKDCSYNPANKRCMTCKHALADINGSYSQSKYCAKRIKHIASRNLYEYLVESNVYCDQYELKECEA